MCSNYVPVQRQLLHDTFKVEPPVDDWVSETLPDDDAPIVRGNVSGRRDSVLANFGIVPKVWMAPTQRLNRTDARAETIASKRPFSTAWNLGNLCLVPTAAFYEPLYTNSTSRWLVRYRISVIDEPVFGVAGIWREWPDCTVSFAMLTVSADHHAVMNRMQRPGAQKRLIVIVPRSKWNTWLTCRNRESAREFLRAYPAELMLAEPAPRRW